jgi:hypothetical protein
MANRVERLEKRENKLVAKGKKAVDEGRDKKADRIFGRAAKVEDRKIKIQERKKTTTTRLVAEKTGSLAPELVKFAVAARAAAAAGPIKKYKKPPLKK